jgi:hypothetical protein
MYIGVSAMPSRSCRFSQTGVVEKMRLCDQAPYYCKEACKSAHAEGPGDGMSRGSTVYSGMTGRHSREGQGARREQDEAMFTHLVVVSASTRRAA